MSKITRIIFMGLLAVSGQIGAQDVAKESAALGQKATTALQASALDSTWTFTGIGSFNTASTTYSNWAAGGNTNVNMVASLNLSLIYAEGKSLWETNFNSDYGLQYLENNLYDWRKSSDQIYLMTKYGYKVTDQWYVTALGRFRSQYTEGYQYNTSDGVETKVFNSNWLAPAYIDVSLGMDWHPNTLLSVYVSPAAGRVTLCDEASLRPIYGLEADESSVMTFGASATGKVVYNKQKNLKLASTLTLFTPYDSDFGQVDVDWDTDISYLFLKVFNVSFKSSLKYYDKVMIADKDGMLHHRIQWMSMFGLGFGYSF